MGPQLEVTADTVFAVTGADMPVSVDGEASAWTSHAVKAGDVISFEYLRSGARAYLALAGGVDVPEVMGSRSTYTLVGMGGFEGRGLAEGDELALLADGDGTPGRSVPEDLRPVFSEGDRAAARRGAVRLPAAARQPRRRSSRRRGRSRRTPTASATATAAASCTSSTARRRTGRAATRRTSPTSATPSARSRCPAASSRSRCWPTP